MDTTMNQITVSNTPLQRLRTLGPRAAGLLGQSQADQPTAEVAAARLARRQELSRSASYWNDHSPSGLAQRRKDCNDLFESLRTQQQQHRLRVPLMVMCVHALLDRTIELARHKNKGVSQKTKSLRKERTELLLRDLKAVGFNMYESTPMELRGRHIRKLVQAWVDASDGRDPGYPVHVMAKSTILNVFSQVRWLMEAIGRKNEVAAIAHYVDDSRRVRVDPRAQRDKSWSGNGIDIQAVIQSIAKRNSRLATAVKAAHLFGLRISEALMFNPATDIAEDGSVFGLPPGEMAIAVMRGAKGGRRRAFIELSPDRRREALDLKAHWIEQYGQEPKRLQQIRGGLALGPARDRLYSLLVAQGIARSNGVVFHGLRAERMLDDAAMLGVPVKVRPGVVKRPIAQQDLVAAQRYMVEVAGHSDVTKARAYYGQITDPDGSSKCRKSPVIINGTMKMKGRALVLGGASIKVMAETLGISSSAGYKLFGHGELKALKAMRPRRAPSTEVTPKCCATSSEPPNSR